MTPIELLGYLATGVVLISFGFEGERMRFINGIGAMLWMVWGFLLSQPPVWILNGLIILIHTVQLIRLRRRREGGLDEVEEEQLSEKRDEK
jgi:TRAP-type C4-dicarboxylate transport system permease small subunit